MQWEPQNHSSLQQEFALDPYSVLGVRENASETEIELAFKGRRSQYHPDRYAQEGEETIRWATGEMQRVNEAYGVLSDPKQRARFDETQARKQGHTAPRSTQTAGASPNDAAAKPSGRSGAACAEGLGSAPEPSVVDYFARLRLESADQARLFVAPSIPAKKAQNAISARGWEGRWYMCDPLVLVDDTLGGGAKEGLLVGEKCVSFKSLFVDPEEYTIQGGFNGGFEAHGTKILRMGDVCKEFVHFSSRGVSLVCQALNEYFDDLRAWHRNRAERGDAESANFMSMSCHGDPDQALYWLRRAADAGLRVAQHNLARNLESRDPAEAFRLFKLAADQGCESSRERMRQMGSKASQYKGNEDDTQREHEDPGEDESSRDEPEEGIIYEYQRDLLRMRSARENAVQKALLDLFDWVIRATAAVRDSFIWQEIELDDEEKFVLSSDIFRFELLPLVVSYALNKMLTDIGEGQSKKVLALVVDGLIVEIVMRKEGLISLRELPELEKAKRLLAQSRLLKPFMSRMVEYQNALASGEDISSLFLKNLQEPMIGRLYDSRSREIVKTMIADVVDSLLDEEATEEVLGEVERCINFAIQTYIDAVYE